MNADAQSRSFPSASIRLYQRLILPCLIPQQADIPVPRRQVDLRPATYRTLDPLLGELTARQNLEIAPHRTARICGRTLSSPQAAAP
jgi:hypothetical protein